MITMTVQTRMDVKKVMRKAKSANIDSLGRAGAYIMTTARRSIRKQGKRVKSNPPGKPPRTKAKRLPRGIRFKVEKAKERVIVGPTHSSVGRSGAAHEHGIKHKGDAFAERPFMGPALKITTPKLPANWSGSIK
jgi:hypothetical protein